MTVIFPSPTFHILHQICVCQIWVFAHHLFLTRKHISREKEKWIITPLLTSVHSPHRTPSLNLLRVIFLASDLITKKWESVLREKSNGIAWPVFQFLKENDDSLVSLKNFRSLPRSGPQCSSEIRQKLGRLWGEEILKLYEVLHFLQHDPQAFHFLSVFVLIPFLAWLENSEIGVRSQISQLIPLTLSLWYFFPTCNHILVKGGASFIWIALVCHFNFSAN